MIDILNTGATVVRDVAILTAAGVALLGVVLGLRTRVETQGGSAIVWRLPLFRHITVVGQATHPLSAREVAAAPDTGLPRGGTEDTGHTTEESGAATEESPPVRTSAWFHVPVAIDRSRDPVELPALALRWNGSKGQKRLHLRSQRVDGSLRAYPPSLRIDIAGGQAPGTIVDLREPEAGRLRDAIVGTWISSLWS